MTFYVSQRLAGRICKLPFVSVNFYLFSIYLYFSAAATKIPEEKEKCEPKWKTLAARSTTTFFSQCLILLPILTLLIKIPSMNVSSFFSLDSSLFSCPPR
jgi:hypothetical protein